MTKVYVSGPYSKGDVVLNVRKAILVAEEISQAGLTPYIPHLTHFWHLIAPHQYEFWMKYDLEWLETCDILYRIYGESSGADREVEWAYELGIPVVHNMMELLDWTRYANVETDI